MSTEAFLIWRLEASMHRYDITIMENNGDMPPEEFTDKMSTHTDCIPVVFSPHELGWPLRRMRLMCAAIDRAAFVWRGPDHTKPALLKEDFLKFFGKRCVADCNVFAGADTVEHVEAERARRAEHAGVLAEKMPSATALDLMKTSKQKEYVHAEVRGATARPCGASLQDHGLRPVPEPGEAAPLWTVVPVSHPRHGPLLA